MNNCAEVINAAKKSFLALKNPYNTIEKTFPLALENYLRQEELPYIRYMGLKNTNIIPIKLKTRLEKAGFVLHTLDKASLGGRAIDISLTNPITGLKMTGSSSGTAINVFCGINDLGVGTDGGGSVLAPAMSLNLFSFISNKIESETVSKYNKKSTDGIVFSPSIGFISRDFDTLNNAISCYFEKCETSDKINVIVPNEQCKIDNVVLKDKIVDKLDKELSFSVDLSEVKYPYLLGDRNTLIEFLKDNLKNCDVLISYEGPVDVYGFGDSVFGCYDDRSANNQSSANKGLIRVVNMVGAAAITVPSTELASGYVLICDNTESKIAKMLQLAKEFICEKNELTSRYFLNFNNYFPKGFGEEA